MAAQERQNHIAEEEETEPCNSERRAVDECEIDEDDDKEENITTQAVKALRKKFVPGLKYSLLIMVAFDFALLVVGCINVHKCPVNPNIPFFLIVKGGIGVFVKFLTYVKDRIIKRMEIKHIESALYFIETVFFITGTYWTYKVFKPHFDDPEDKYYCNKTAYMFAFVYLTIIYTLILGLLVFVCCFIVCFCALAKAAIDAIPELESQVPYIDETPSAEERRSQAHNK